MESMVDEQTASPCFFYAEIENEHWSLTELSPENAKNLTQLNRFFDSLMFHCFFLPGQAAEITCRRND
jgi:hypothetical protein